VTEWKVIVPYHQMDIKKFKENKNYKKMVFFSKIHVIFKKLKITYADDISRPSA
jgi:hypothetical protein